MVINLLYIKKIQKSKTLTNALARKNLIIY